MKLFVCILIAIGIFNYSVSEAGAQSKAKSLPKANMSIPFSKSNSHPDADPFRPKASSSSQAIDCRANWSARSYKTFENIQNEVQRRYKNTKILRISLCGKGKNAYFQIVVITDQGLVKRMQFAASK